MHCDILVVVLAYLVLRLHSKHGFSLSLMPGYEISPQHSINGTNLKQSFILNVQRFSRAPCSEGGRNVPSIANNVKNVPDPESHLSP